MARLGPRAEFGLVVAIGYGGVITAQLVSLASGGFERRIVFADVELAATLAMELVLGGVILAVLFARGRRAADLRPEIDGTGTAVGVFLFAAAMLASWLAEGIALSVDGARVSSVSVRGTLHPAMIVAASALNPCFEEALHLGYVQERLRSTGPGFAIGVSLALRLALHIYQGPLAVVGIVPLGLVLGAYHWHARRVWPAIVAHALGDLIGLWALTPPSEI